MACLPDRAVAHVITDPPYDQRTSEGARRSAWKGGKGIDREGRFIGFDGLHSVAAVVGESLRIADRWCLWFCALEQLGSYREASGDAWIRAGLWDRLNGAPQFTGDRPAQACEGIAIAHRRGKKRWHGGGKRGVWTSCVEKDARTIGHETPKPLPLMLSLMIDFTDEDDVVLDPFAGSGTTLLAALRAGRRAIGVEIQPKYAALARERMMAEESGSTLQAARAGQAVLFG